MNWSHARTVIWLRWRLLVNQVSRLSALQRVTIWLLFALAVLVSIGAFFGSWLVGILFFPETPPEWLILLWDAVVVSFVFFWCIGVLTDLQQSESVSLTHFLHLPISPRHVFTLNYLNNWISVTVVVFMPMMLGLALVLSWRYGPVMLLTIPLVFAFLLMVTSATHQFRSWLASLMINKRTRQAVIVLLTVAFIAIVQLPNVLNWTVFQSLGDQHDPVIKSIEAQRRALAKSLADNAIATEEFEQRNRQLDEQSSFVRSQARQTQLAIAMAVNGALPPGWLPLGVDAIAQGRTARLMACLFGMILVGGFCLNRSYKTTLRFYRGGFQLKTQTRKIHGRQDASATVDGSAEYSDRLPVSDRWFETNVPGLNMQQSIVALAELRGFLRAPEVKLAIAAPLVAILIIGASMFVQNANPIPLELRGFAAIGIIVFAILGILQLVQNQFGYDRAGFRLYLLSPISERDVLIGKNMGLMPIGLGLAIIGLVAMQIFCPMRWSHFATTLVHFGTIFLIACMIGNFVSIIAPLAVAPGTMKPVNLKMGVVVLQLLVFVTLPVCISPTMVPLVVEFVLRDQFAWNPNLPVALLLSIVLLAVTWVGYRYLVSLQADLLRQRKWAILETVTSYSA